MRLGVGVALLVIAACGRSGFDETFGDGGAPPDYSPDPLDWADFSRISTAVVIAGTNLPIDLEIRTSYGTGMPMVQYRINGTDFYDLTPATPTVATVSPGDTLQFRVGGAVGDTAFLTVINRSSFDALIDTTVGTVSSLVTGGGTASDPFVAPDPRPASCNDYLAGYSEQQDVDGIYRVALGGTTTDVYCDMESDTGGWTLVARVLAASTTHTTTAALGTLTEPTQATTAKLADALINTMAFTHQRYRIDGVGTVYATVPTISLGTTGFSQPMKAAPAFTGPYAYQLYTSTTCSGDCGVSVVNQNMGFGNYCGYRYWASGGNPRPGMGCNGNHTKNGTVWVK